MPLLLGVQVYTYEANEVVPIYISPMEYIYNGGQYATFDYENNQFYHYQTYGGGGGCNWDATVIYGENGQLVKDFASMGAGSPDGISPFEVDGSVYEKIQTVNFRETDYEDETVFRHPARPCDGTGADAGDSFGGGGDRGNLDALASVESTRYTGISGCSIFISPRRYMPS